MTNDQNHSLALLNLGIIFYDQNIEKSIYYFTRSSDQGNSQSQFNLGIIYSNDKFIQRDINKSIHYLSFVSNQNHPDAQFNKEKYDYKTDIYSFVVVLFHFHR